MTITPQLTLLPPDQLAAEIETSRSTHGEVFTRPWVVEFILDNMLGTNFTGDVAETVRDLILGLLGAMVFLIGHWLGVRDAEQHEKDLG